MILFFLFLFVFFLFILIHKRRDFNVLRNSVETKKKRKKWITTLNQKKKEIGHSEYILLAGSCIAWNEWNFPKKKKWNKKKINEMKSKRICTIHEMDESRVARRLNISPFSIFNNHIITFLLFWFVRCQDVYGEHVNIHEGHLCGGTLNGKGGTCVGNY